MKSDNNFILKLDIINSNTFSSGIINKLNLIHYTKFNTKIFNTFKYLNKCTYLHVYRLIIIIIIDIILVLKTRIGFLWSTKLYVTNAIPYFNEIFMC